jgi:hypothetical protein
VRPAFDSLRGVHQTQRARFRALRLTLEPSFPRVSSPATSPDAGSDMRRGYLARLRYVFRFSQPLDVLFRPHPLGLVSCRIRPWGCGFQRFPSSSSRHGFRRALPHLPLVVTNRLRVLGLLHLEDPFTTYPCYGVASADPLLALCPFEEFSPRVLAWQFGQASSPGLSHNAGKSNVVAALQSFKEPEDRRALFRELPSSLRFSPCLL